MKTNFVYNQSTDWSSPVDTCCLVGRLAGLAALSLRMSRAGKRCSSLQPPPITIFSTTDRFSSDSLQHGPSNIFSPKKDSNQSIISLFKVIVIGNPSYFKVITNEQTCERVSRREAGPKENIKNISHFFLFSFSL